MKVLMLNGSCNPKGCTYTALTEVGKTLTSAGIDYEIVQLGGGPVRDCIGCNQCSKRAGCVFTDDGVNDFVGPGRKADGFVFGTPVYYAHPSGRVLSFLDRVFYAGGSAFAGKPGRGGLRPAGRHHRQSTLWASTSVFQHGNGGLHLLEHGPRPLSR